MQPAYTTTPYTIHYRGSPIKSTLRTRTSYRTTILLRYLLLSMYPVPRCGCWVHSDAPYNVAPYSVPSTASGTYSGHDCEGYRQKTETITILVPSYTVIRSCGIPRNTETQYRYSIFSNTGKYGQISVTRFERTVFHKIPDLSVFDDGIHLCSWQEEMNKAIYERGGLLGCEVHVAHAVSVFQTKLLTADVFCVHYIRDRLSYWLHMTLGIECVVTDASKYRIRKRKTKPEFPSWHSHTRAVPSVVMGHF